MSGGFWMVGRRRSAVGVGGRFLWWKVVGGLRVVGCGMILDT